MKYLLLLTISLLSFQVWAQKSLYKGSVSVTEIYPLNQVKVTSKKTKETVKTDTLGRFEINVMENDILYFEAEGFAKRRIKLKYNPDSNTDMIFKGTNTDYDKALRAAHSEPQVLKALLIEPLEDKKSYMDIYEMVQSKHPQARIIQNRGSADKAIYLISKGPHSLGYSKQDALLVVNGMVVQTISGVVPIEVDEIRVLEGTEAAHYGMRGACGVVEIDLNSYASK